jgi:hypothetical protein
MKLFLCGFAVMLIDAANVMGAQDKGHPKAKVVLCSYIVEEIRLEWKNVWGSRGKISDMGGVWGCMAYKLAYPAVA